MANKDGVDWSKKDMFDGIGRPDLKKKAMAKKMKPLGHDMHDTFSKLGKAVGKLGSTHKKYGDKPF